MKKKLLMLLSLISLMCLGACGPTSSGDYIEEYTVIWQNDNGDILEMDRHVKEGTLPSYDGEIPTKNPMVLINIHFRVGNQKFMRFMKIQPLPQRIQKK